MLNKLVVIAALIAAFVYWGRQPDKPQRPADRSQVIEMYTTSFCGECKRAKAYMDGKGIQYVELDVENDIDLRREFYDRGGKGTPLIFVYGKKMQGFNPQRFEQLRSRRG